MNVYLGELYKEVEYIQSSGTQYINTDFVFSTNTEVTLDIQYTSTAAQQRLVGTYLNSSPVMWEQYINGSTQWARSIDNNSSGGYWQSTNISADTNRHTFVSNNSRYIIYTNGTQVYNGANTRSFTAINDAKLTLLAGTNGTSITNFSRAKLYGCKITDNGTLVRDFIPCYRVSDNVIGLFDKVNNKFYTNAGTGSFTKGSDVKVFQPELKNAYIGEYYPLIQNASLLGNTNTKQDVQGAWFSPDGTKMFVGFWNLSYVTEYTLSTPFNPSTKAEIRTLSGTYQNSGMWFNHDGTIMILSTRVNSSFPTYIQKYTLSTPFALNTATLVQSYSVGNKFTAGVCLSDDGKKIYINIDGEGIYQGTMSTAFDLSTISLSSGTLSSGGRGIALRGNGKILYTSNSNAVGDYGLISQYKLNTPYDILGSKTLLSTFNAGGGEGTALWVSEDMEYFSWCLGGNTSQDVRMFKTN